MRPTFTHQFPALAFLLLLACFLLASLLSIGQTAKQTNGGFLLLNGQDTLSVERFSRAGNATEGRVLFQKQVPIVFQIEANPQNQLKKLSLLIMKPGATEGTPPRQAVTLQFAGDSIVDVSQKGDSLQGEVIKTTAGALAYHPQLPLISLLEQMTRRARTIGGTEASFPLFLLNSQNKTVTANVTFSGKDSALVSFGNIKVHLLTNAEGAILGGKTATGQTIKRLTSVPDAALSTKAPDYSAPAGAPYTAEEVRIKTKAGHVLAGTLTLPKNAGKAVPVVVTITGSSPQDRDNNTPFGGPYQLFRQLAHELGKKGIAVLRMDDRGVGQSTGNLESATSADRAEDIREGIKFAQAHRAIDPNQVVLVGLSEGGLIAPMIAQTNKKLKGIVLMAGPASTGKEVMEYQVQNTMISSKEMPAAQKEEAKQKAMADILQEAENNPWLKFYLTYDPLTTAKKVKDVPVLILHGTTDKNVPPADAEKLAQAFRQAGNKDVTVKMFDEVNHVFLKDPDGNPKNYQNLKSFKVGPDVLEPIAEWVTKKTRGAL